MKCMVRLSRLDCVTGETEVIAEAPCLYDGKRLLYKENNTGARHMVALKENGLSIERTADVQSVLELVKEGASRCVIKSTYGVMELGARLLAYTNDGDSVEAEYIVLSGEETTAHLKMTWELKKAS